jgi:hypothetical protein
MSTAPLSRGINPINEASDPVERPRNPSSEDGNTEIDDIQPSNTEVYFIYGPSILTHLV